MPEIMLEDVKTMFGKPLHFQIYLFSIKKLLKKNMQWLLQAVAEDNLSVSFGPYKMYIVQLALQPS